MISMGKSKKNPVILNENEMDSTLVDLDTLALAIPQSQEVEEKVELISEIESLAEINKQALAARRQIVEIEVEGKKLETAMKTIDSIDKIINAVSSADVLSKVTKNIKTPMDMKMMAEAAERLTNTLKNLMNPNTIDAMGTKKKQKINFMFKSNGPIQAAVQIDNSDD
jgi:Xaa-Pro aminopeptidase